MKKGSFVIAICFIIAILLVYFCLYYISLLESNVLNNIIEEQEITSIDLHSFVALDTTNEMNNLLDAEYAKILSKNALEYNIKLGGFLLHIGNKNNNDKYVLNYYIINNKFYIINPKTDKFYDLEAFSKSNDFPIKFRYVTLYPDVTYLPNYKMVKQTRDFDRMNPLSEIELIEKIKLIYSEPIKTPTPYVPIPQNTFITKVTQTPTIVPTEIKNILTKQQLNFVGAKGNTIVLLNNPNAKNPTYNKLMKFIRNDDTDEIKYDYNSFVCADFAEQLHNRAEKSRIKSYWVVIDFSGYTEGHALNVFETTDQGLIFIDCTGSETYTGHNDCQAFVELGQYYSTKFTHSNERYNVDNEYWKQFGKITNIEIY